MRNICVEVAGLLEEVANSGEDDEDEEQPQRSPAAQRFAEAVLSSTAAANAMGVPTDDSSRCVSSVRSLEQVLVLNGDRWSAPGGQLKSKLPRTVMIERG